MAKAGCRNGVAATVLRTCRRARCGIGGAAAALLAGLCNAESSQASAFFIRDQSAAALGNAFAGATAGADDITYTFFNGAALSRQQGSQAAFVGTSILAGTKFHGGAASTVQGVPIDGGDGGRNGGGTSLVPALYGLWDLSDSFDQVRDLALGLAINAPFGFETEYENGWMGRYYALQSRVRSVDFNPVVAYQPIEGLSLAIGLQAQYIDAKLSNAIDFGTIGALKVPGAVPAAQDGFAKLTGDDWGFGYTAGLLLEPWSGTRFGIAYRSQIQHQLEGDARVRLDSAGIGAALGAGGTTGAKAEITTPEILSFGAYHELDSAWAVMADASWTRWSRFRTLRIKFSNGSQPDDVTEQDWRDTWFFAVGCTFRPTQDWTLRSGIGYDQSPARHSTRTPRTPVNNGLLLSLGASYVVTPGLDLAFGYSHYFIESARIDLRADAPGNAARGNLSGSTDNVVDTLSLQLRYVF
jgi:long-chain fatty acid transport protein